MSTKSVIKDYLVHVKRDTPEEKLNLCAWIYDNHLNGYSNAEEIFSWFLKNADAVESDDSEICAETVKSSIKKLTKDYGRLVDACLEKLLRDNPEENNFYKYLWKSISDNPLLDTRESKIFALFYIWIDARIPFFHLASGVQMDNQKFSDITESIRSDIDKARFIIRTNFFEQRTGRSSVLLELIDSIKDKEKRVVLMAHIISFLSVPFSTEDIARMLFRDRSRSTGDKVE